MCPTIIPIVVTLVWVVIIGGRVVGTQKGFDETSAGSWFVAGKGVVYCTVVPWYCTVVEILLLGSGTLVAGTVELVFGMVAPVALAVVADTRVAWVGKLGLSTSTSLRQCL